MAIVLRVTSLGLEVRALIQNRDAARLVGIDVDRVQRVSFLLGFGMAALAGALISSIEQISPSMGFPFTISAYRKTLSSPKLINKPAISRYRPAPKSCFKPLREELTPKTSARLIT